MLVMLLKSMVRTSPRKWGLRTICARGKGGEGEGGGKG
jgi:hypothetical protein